MVRGAPYFSVVVDELDLREGLAERQHLADSRAALMSWFDTTGRDLPWRNTRDPWVILVSELMLQQTQVSRVVDRLARFIDRFPTPSACAAKPSADVIDEWKGLGYNRRAVNLHRAATAIADEHAGVVPDDLARLLALPGVGAYTARAVMAFAFERDVGVVDTNIARVLARIEGERLTPGVVQRMADELVPAGAGWRWNQSIMELGALVCRPAPTCATCPVADSCTWHLAAHSNPDPSVGSAKVSKGQSRFEGSDRQGRGRLVDALRAGSVPDVEIAVVMGWPDDRVRAERVALTLLTDGLAELSPGGDTWCLPS